MFYTNLILDSGGGVRTPVIELSLGAVSTPYRDEVKDEPVIKQVRDLYEELNIQLVKYVRSLGLPASDADDVMQETFLRLMNHLNADRPKGNLRAWLFQVAYSQAMDLYRFEKRFASLSDELGEGVALHKELQSKSPSIEDIFIESEKMTRVEAELFHLPMQQRRCVLLRSEGLRYREIASNLGVSTQRVAILVGRGVSRLAAKL